MTIQLNSKLLAADPPVAGAAEFRATIRAHGEYMPLAFVLRLSPLIHQKLAALPQTGIYSSREIGLDGAQAFSTYLHETVHWWQHVGSTYGLMSSLSYPARAHGSYKQIKELVSLEALRKSVRQMAEKAAGPSTPDTVKGLANIVVNNHFDLSAFSKFSYNQEFAKGIASSAMFESLGHLMCRFISGLATMRSPWTRPTLRSISNGSFEGITAGCCPLEIWRRCRASRREATWEPSACACQSTAPSGKPCTRGPCR